MYHPSAAGIGGGPSDWEDDSKTLPEAHSNFNQVFNRYRLRCLLEFALENVESP